MASFYGGEKGQSFKAHIYRGPNTLEDAKILEGEFLVIGDGIVSQNDIGIDAEKDYRGSFWIKKFTNSTIQGEDKVIRGHFNDDNEFVLYKNGKIEIEKNEASFYYELFTWIHGQPESITIGETFQNEITAQMNAFQFTMSKDNTTSKVKIDITKPKDIEINKVELEELDPINSPTANVIINKKDGDLEFSFGLPRAATFTQEDGTILNTPIQGFTAELNPKNNGDYILKTTRARPIKIAEDVEGNKLIDSNNTLENANSTPTVEIDTDDNGDLKFDFNFPRPIEINYPQDLTKPNVQVTQLDPNESPWAKVQVNQDDGDLEFQFGLPRGIQISEGAEHSLSLIDNTDPPQVTISTNTEGNISSFNFMLPKILINNKVEVTKATSEEAEMNATFDFSETNNTYSLTIENIPKGDKGDQGIQGIQGIQGETGNGIASVTIDENDELIIGYTNGEIINLGKVIGPQGDTGAQGFYFTPLVSKEGVLSWTNNGGLDNPLEVNIKGPQGEQGNGLIIKGDIEKLEDLKDIAAPSLGDAYRLKTNNDIYIYIKQGNEQVWTNFGQLQGAKGDKGDQGKPFTYEDFTPDQLEKLKGEPFKYENFTQDQLAELVGPTGSYYYPSIENGILNWTKYESNTSLENPASFNLSQQIYIGANEAEANLYSLWIDTSEEK